MHDPQNNPVNLLSVPNDLEAAMVVSALAAHEVDATTAGEFTSGFRAEAPGLVSVLVRQRDLPRAREVLSELESERPEEKHGPSATAVAATPMSLPSLLGWIILAAFAVWLIYR